jgi:DNA-binding XRE family transcriptional regulator
MQKIIITPAIAEEISQRHNVYVDADARMYNVGGGDDAVYGWMPLPERWIASAHIRIARASLGLNTADFGARIGVSGRTVEGYEQGVRMPPKSVLMLIQQIL